jgi:excisionase family DNA binding protein
MTHAGGTLSYAEPHGALNSTGNAGLDALADAIANRVLAHLQRSQDARLLSVREAAEYLGRTQKALRHMVANGTIPAVRDRTRALLGFAYLSKVTAFLRSTRP